MRNQLLTAAVLAFTTVALAQTSGQANSQTSSTTSVQTGQTGASANTNANTGAYGSTNGSQAQGSANTGADANVQAGQTGANASTSGNTNAQSSRSNGSSNANAAGASSIAGDTTIPATLTKGVDAKKAKSGDEVTAKTTQDVRSAGSVVIPKGSKLVGHVTEAHAKGNGQSDSALGIAFDHAVLKNGQHVPFTANIQAVAAAANNTALSSMDDSGGFSAPASPSGSMGGAPSGAMGGVGNTVGSVGNTAGGIAGGAANTVGNTAGNVGSSVGSTAAGTTGSATGKLTSNAHGVVGLTGYTLSSAASTSTNGSVITSTQKNVKLDSGTQLLLQVNGSQE